MSEQRFPKYIQIQKFMKYVKKLQSNKVTKLKHKVIAAKIFNFSLHPNFCYRKTNII
jgi:hypothetical protein